MAETQTAANADWFTPEELRAETARIAATTNPTLRLPGAPTLGAAPDVNAPAAGPAALPTVGGGVPASLAKPTASASRAAGAAEYQRAMPQVTAAAGTPEWQQQQTDQAKFKQLHPIGGDVSAKPGGGGKFLHALGEVGNVAGSILAPGITAMVPGSTLNNRLVARQQQNDVARGEEATQKELANKGTALGQEMVPWVNPTDGSTQMIERNQWAPANAAALKAETAQQKTDATIAGQDKRQVAALRAFGLQPGANGGPPEAIPDSQLSPKELQVRDMNSALEKYHTAEAEVEAAKNDPNSFQGQLAMQHLQVAKGELAEKYASLGVQEQKTAAEANRTDKGAIKSFNHDYVTPAQAVEKSYDMMDTAYREYQQAKAAGKGLPSGAQSMVALSTHLSTTFGNVKGARISKDMIEHHLGARSISDDALVAIQKLTTGDVLSPAQWDAFHQLISQSRAITWHQAVRAADRAQIPLDFLPDDLQATMGEGVAYTPTQANPTGPGKTPPATPPATTPPATAPGGAAGAGGAVQSFSDFTAAQKKKPS